MHFIPRFLALIKFCPCCGKEKPYLDFCNSARSADGLDYKCKECQKNSLKILPSKNKKEKCLYVKTGPRKRSLTFLTLFKCCSQCKNEKTYLEFYKYKGSLDGLQGICSQCNNKYTKEYELKNPEKVQKWRKQTRIKNIEKRKKYYREHREERLEYRKEYDKKNELVLREKRKKYNQKNRAIQREKAKIRYQNDLNHRISQNVRTRIRRALQGKNKSKETFDLVGCDLIFLKIYLESKFTEGMTWENYGHGENKWNIDHIKPCCKFDLSNPEQQKECFHYTNTQPMWFNENLKKNGFYAKN